MTTIDKAYVICGIRITHWHANMAEKNVQHIHTQYKKQVRIHITKATSLT